MTTAPRESPGSPGVLRLHACLRIADLAEFKAQCDTMLGSAVEGLVCDASAVDVVDAATLQYLVSLRQACTARAAPTAAPRVAARGARADDVWEEF